MMTFRFLTILFNFDTTDTDVKEKIKREIGEINLTFFVDEYANGLKFLIESETLGAIATALKKKKLDGGLLNVEGKDDEYFVFINKPEKKADPTTMSFDELDTERLKNLF